MSYIVLGNKKLEDDKMRITVEGTFKKLKQAVSHVLKHSNEGGMKVYKEVEEWEVFDLTNSRKD